MNQTFILKIFFSISLSKKLFTIASSFVFGYYIGYYSYNFFKPKKTKAEINDFILRNNIKHGIVSKKIEQIKIPDDCYFGENLEHEHNFLNDLEEKIQEKFEDFDSSNFFGKRTLSLCVEMNQEITEIKAKKLLKIVDWLTDKHFAKKLILREVGWCAQQML